jgi:hypothetical protein
LNPLSFVSFSMISAHDVNSIRATSSERPDICIEKCCCCCCLCCCSRRRRRCCCCCWMMMMMMIMMFQTLSWSTAHWNGAVNWTNEACYACAPLHTCLHIRQFSVKCSKRIQLFDVLLKDCCVAAYSTYICSCPGGVVLWYRLRHSEIVAKGREIESSQDIGWWL